MSHNYPYRRPPSDSNPRPDSGSYGSSDLHRTSSDFSRPPQESLSQPSSSSSSSSSRGAHWSQEGALSILSSCGLEPSDLALLAELPEDVLTVESLPQVLRQIKGKRDSVKSFPPSAPAHSSSSTLSSFPPTPTLPPVNPPTGHWDNPRNQPRHTVPDQVTPPPLLPELSHWDHPSSIRTGPPPSSSSSYMVDFHHGPGLSADYGRTSRDSGPVSSKDYNHRPASSSYSQTISAAGPASFQDYNYKPAPSGRDTGLVSSSGYNYRPGPSDYGKTGKDAGPVSSQDYRPGPSGYGEAARGAGSKSSQDRPSFSSAAGNQRPRPSCFSQPADQRLAPPPDNPGVRHETSSTTTRTRSRGRPSALMPSKQEAMDFHGTPPSTFPYSCCLCDITVMSEKVWIKHINGPRHAEGQLNLLQQFPNWDCRMETLGSPGNQSDTWKDEGQPAQQPQTANQKSSKSQSKNNPNAKPKKKTSDRSKVVCVRFPAQSVDEAYLRKLTEPFGKIGKILMFPSLAFVELGSVDQARDLVKFHANYPPTVNGEQIDFRISNTFNFLQSSRVVSFAPSPSGEDSRSDLISIVRRFGSPLYTLFLPSKAFVEMKNAPDAQKLVDYYSSRTLRINDAVLSVSFSGEYNSLMRVTSAQRIEDETSSARRSSSPQKEDKGRSTKDSRDSRTRSRSRERSSKEKIPRTRSRSRERSSKEKIPRTRSRSRERSSKEKIPRTRSRSRERSSKEKIPRTRSRSTERSSKEKIPRTRSRSTERSSVVPVKAETTDAESRTDPDPLPVTESKPEAEDKDEMDEEADSSDIEGMEVIGEDGESLQDEEEQEEEEEQQEEEEEEQQEEDSCPAGTDAPEDKEEEAPDGAAGDQEVMEEEEEPNRGEEQELDEEEPDFPVDLENCITLDELEEDPSEDEEVRLKPKSQSRRVVVFKDIPPQPWPDSEFLRLVKDFGTAVHYYRDPERKFGFIEMSTSSEAQRVVSELPSRGRRIGGYRPSVCISNNYLRLSRGRPVPTSKEDKKTDSRRSDKHRRNESQGRKESSGKTSEEEATPRRSKEKNSSKAPEKKSKTSRGTQDKPAEKTGLGLPEKTTEDKNSPEDSAAEDAQEQESSPKKGPEKMLKRKGSLERDSVSPKKGRTRTDETPETDESKDRKTSETDESKDRKTPETDKSKDRKTPETDESKDRKTSETDKSKDRKTPETDKSKDRKTPETDESKDRKTPETDESKDRKTPETDESKDRKTSETDESKDRKTPETDKSKDRKTPETDKSKDRKTPETDESKDRKTSETDESKDRKTPETDESKDRKTPETDESKDRETSEWNQHKVVGVKEETPGPGLKGSEGPGGPEPAGAPPRIKSEKVDASALQDSGPAGGASALQDSGPAGGAAALQDSGPAGGVSALQDSGPAGGASALQDSGPAGGAAALQDSGGVELQRPSRPVGTEFVRPVVGYFCNLCQLIYADEDEAKLQHCSSREHYDKYQEKTGRDPWTP